MIGLTELPPRISEYLGSYYTTLKNLRLASRYGLKGENLEKMSLLIGGVFSKAFEVKELPTYLRVGLKMDTGQSFLLAAEIGEQHLRGFEDFLGPVVDVVQQWRVWGREFGGKEPVKTASPKVERLIAAAGATHGPVLEFRKMTSAPGKAFNQPKSPVPVPKAGARKVPMPVTPARTTAAQKTGRVAPPRLKPQAARPAQRTAFAAPPAQTLPTGGVSREQFLKQLQNFKIEALRPAGQSAALRLGQLNQQLATVLAGAPQDRPKVQTALRGSPLFTLYQEQGQAAIRSGKPLDHVIYERYQAGQAYLLKEEFDAVAKLMKAIQ